MRQHKLSLIVILLIQTLLTATCMHAEENPAITNALKEKYDDVVYVHGRDFRAEFPYYFVSAYHVRLNNLEGVCDTLGKEIVPPVYKDVRGGWDHFTADDANGLSSVFSKDGIKLVSENSKLRFCKVDEDYIICMSEGTTYNEGISTKIRKNGKWGVFSLKSKTFSVSPKYEFISTFSEGLAPFCVGGKVEEPNAVIWPKGGKWGFINEHGEIVIDAIYDKVSWFEDGYSQVTLGSKITLIPNPINSSHNIAAQSLKHREAPKANFTNDNLFAVIIGNSYFPGDVASTSSLADSDLFHKYCTQTLGCPEKNIQHLTDATYANILKAFSHLREVADVYDGDAKIIIYYSGLGAADKNGKRYILPTDVESANIPSTSISLNAISDLFNSINTAYSLAIIDAPFDGLDKKGQSFTTHRGVMIKEAASTALHNNSFILTAAGQNGRAYTLKDEDVSLFTDAILSTMDSSMNKTSITSFIDNVMKKTKQASIGLGDKLQSPQLIKSENNNTVINTLSF